MGGKYTMYSRKNPALRTNSSRAIAATAVAASTVIALAGCLAPANPEPTETAASASDCTPETANIFWNKAIDAGEVNVGAYLLPGTGAEEGALPEVIQLEPEVEFTGDGLNLLTDFDTADREAWETALLEDARQTGQVDRDWGEQTPLPEAPVSTVTYDAPGTAVQVMSRPKLSMPYEIQCDGMDPVEGTVISVLSSELGNTFYLCADTIELTSVQAEYAAELCLDE
jgi:hypothetical protein